MSQFSPSKIIALNNLPVSIKSLPLVFYQHNAFILLYFYLKFYTNWLNSCSPKSGKTCLCRMFPNPQEKLCHFYVVEIKTMIQQLVNALNY